MKKLMVIQEKEKKRNDDFVETEKPFSFSLSNSIELY